jgi:hypothetical protein
MIANSINIRRERENEKIDDVGYVCGVDDAENSVTFTAISENLTPSDRGERCYGFPRSILE